MYARKSTFNFSVIIPILAVLMMLGYQAVATHNSESPTPITMATVDLEKVFEGLDERGAEDIRLQTLAAQKQEEEKEYQETLTKMQEQLEDVLVPNSPKYQSAEKELIRKSIEYQAWKEFTVRELDREKAIVLAKLYKSIKQSLKTMAEQQGYDIVLLNDSIKDIQLGTEQQVTTQISARRILYSNDTLNITNELIIRMNNNFNASQ